MRRRLTIRSAPFAVAALLAAVAAPSTAGSAPAPGARASAGSPPAAVAPLTVYAAASLTNVLDELGAEYRRATGRPVRFSYAATSVLAKQLEAGARVDVFFSADREWMDWLQQRRLIEAATRADVVGNRLVLVAPADSRVQLAIAPGFAIGRALGDGRLATADPDTVPAGRYARAALTKLGVWAQVESRLVRAENVRAALAFVGRGEVPLGIVYATDAKIDPKVRIVGTFPPDSHPPVTYPAAVVAGAQPGAADFLRFLRGAGAQAVFARHGFLPTTVR
ncbi:MAG: molybdate ABC transporter substrate-binding protein [Steroidobacteraceae bacterium]|nr:molybdate ABC transporter substrate-binding protein [Steroidobacteraceae bacterium]